MICAIILAAGNSSRFGSNKLLHTVNNIPMYQRTVNLIAQLNPAQKIIVTKYPKLYQNIDSSFHIIENYDTSLGQSHSMQLGIKKSLQLDTQITGFLFIVSDQPYLTINSLQKLCTTWQKKRGICALAYNTKRGNPIIFDRKYLQELLTIKGDIGGRSIIKNHLNELTLVQAKFANELFDIDTITDTKISKPY